MQKELLKDQMLDQAKSARGDWVILFNFTAEAGRESRWFCRVAWAAAFPCGDSQRKGASADPPRRRGVRRRSGVTDREVVTQELWRWGGHLGRWRWEGPTQSLRQEEAKEEERERGKEVSWGMPSEAADP